MRAATVQAQRQRRGEGTRSRDEAQTQPVVVRLPRMKRCPCCLKWRRGPGDIIRYRLVNGAEVETFKPKRNRPAGLPDSKPGEWEMERVTVFRSTGGHNYERIRGGRWVDWWQAEYGRHTNESREWVRRGNAP